MEQYTINVNGKKETVEAEWNTPLLWVLRDQLGLVGTKFGCGIAQCGACTVHLDDKPVRACTYQIASVGDGNIVTIEGLSEQGDHPVQEAWETFDVPQCGYCQAGQIMTAVAFLKENPNPDQAEIRRAMHGNICRCGAYNRIEKAVAHAAKNM